MMMTPFQWIDLPLPEEPTPEVGDNYSHIRTPAFPHGVTLANGRVISQNRGLDGNSIKCAYNNPILDKNIYHVEFDDGDIMELTANAITELMYSQCDIDGNQFLLLDNFAEYRKSNTALTTIPEQESVDTIGCI